MKVNVAIEYLENLKKDSPFIGGYVHQTGIDDVKELLKSLKAENKALKKENKFHRRMWEELENKYIDKLIADGDVSIMVNQQLRRLELEYLGGK